MRIFAILKRCAQQLNVTLHPSMTAIQSLPAPDANSALRIKQQLENQGIIVAAFRPPSTPNNQSLIRITVNTEHTTHHIDELIEKISQAYEINRSH